MIDNSPLRAYNTTFSFQQNSPQLLLSLSSSSISKRWSSFHFSIKRIPRFPLQRTSQANQAKMMKQSSIVYTLLFLALVCVLQVFAAPTPSPTLEARSSSKHHNLQARSSESGDATYYTVGLGSCGDTNSDSEMVAALSSQLMGSGSKSSYCGKSITIKSKSGKSVTVKVVDTCPSCDAGDIDLSPAAFKKLGSLDLGVIPISWSL